MNKFEIITSKAFMYFFGFLGITAFICAMFGAWWHIFSGIACTLIYLALRGELKKEEAL
jgi:uncharacterized membrane protein